MTSDTRRPVGKVLHSVAMLRPTAGIVRQMEYEMWAAQRLGLAWQARIFCPDLAGPGAAIRAQLASFAGLRIAGRRWPRALRWILLRLAYYRHLFTCRDIDCFVLRYNVHDVFQLGFILLTSRPVYLVHHAMEVSELWLSGTLVGRGRAIFEWLIGRFSVRAATGLICVTTEIAAYQKTRLARRARGQKPVHVYPNGIWLDTLDCDGALPATGRQAWLFVASVFYPWQGLDLLLDALRASSLDVCLHLVGELSPAQQSLAALDSRVQVHGVLEIEAIRQLAQECVLGISSLALDRQGLSEACALKVREYLVMGLPVVGDYVETLPDGFAYYCNLRGDRSVERIHAYGRAMGGRSRRAIVEAARPFIDKQALLHGLWQALMHDRTSA